jgi:hypothetical protein
MKTLARLLPLGLLFLVAAGDAPTLAPARDVTVTYRIVRAISPGGPAKLELRETATGAKLRVDSYIFLDARTPYEGMILDRKTGSVSILVFARRAVVESHADDFVVPGITLTPDMRFQRRGDKTVAGFKCTDWDVTPASGDPWTACVTRDGVVLRATSAKREMEATSVKFEPLLASTFVPDKDLRRMVTAPTKP